GVECAAAADLYDGRHMLAREIVRADLPVTRRYQTLLEDKNIDCIVAAVPDHWHKQVVVDAVSAGKDIYCEKPMSHSPADGVAMVEAAKKSGRVVQIGSQRVSSQIFAKARELISQGMLGNQLPRLGKDLRAHALRADLHDAAALLRRFDHGHTVGGAVRHRLLTVDVLARAHGIDDHLLVPVIRNRR